MNDRTRLEQVRGIRKAVYIALAGVSLGLGLLGAVLPGLPTTPFLLITSYLLLRCSPWLHAKVLQIPMVGRYVRDWDEKRGVRRGVKALAATWVVLAVALVLLATTLAPPLKAAVVLLAIVGLTVIWRLPTIEDDG